MLVLRKPLFAAAAAAMLVSSCATTEPRHVDEAPLRATPAASEAAALPQTGADAFAEALAADPSRAAGLFHHYEFDEIRDTPPPEGYRPFYVAHYGRHGSRYQIDEKRSFAAVGTLEAAHEAGALTPAGEALLERLRPIIAEHDGMYGQLARLGAEEHRRLAKRMHDRFSEIFADGGKVRCQSSTIQRCLVSMANFATTLKGENPALDFSFVTGDRTMRTILHPYLPSEERKAWLTEFNRDIVLTNVVPDRLMERFFADVPATRELVPEPHRFAFDLFAAANSFQSLERELGGTSIDDVFTSDEILGLARARSCIHYAAMGAAAEYGECVSGSAHDLAAEIARSAEEAITSGGVCADLRFGHDSGLLPLLGFLGLEGVGASVPAAESWKVCPTWKAMPMASNLQIVLYRKDGGDILAKVLFNEKETALCGLVPAAPGPYYRWSDVKARLESGISDSVR